MCLAALSVEDIDIYLFGTMITGILLILLIGLGFTLGYRRIQKTGTAVQSRPFGGGGDSGGYNKILSVI